ncbi:MAG: helix-turn-helix domain-containing protein [Acidimicrobiia bacterium]|nr:helix-turn-helix domain-containing protein [Actinomycetota bacterium]MBL6924996.1 helix-turn-helix domain-containing protein [Acidimicrobiia bacterium]MBL6927452.1 helix-turn-helix domain-containing protein [Acidimicrobiia bacterium]
MSRPVHPLIAALAPVAEALGAGLLEPDQITAADLPLVWEGEVVGGLRRPDLHNALDVLIKAAETDLGVDRNAMDRTQKQAAVALLNEWGAFTLRKSVEDVADALGVSRFTIYNYLERAESA